MAGKAYVRNETTVEHRLYKVEDVREFLRCVDEVWSGYAVDNLELDPKELVEGRLKVTNFTPRSVDRTPNA